MAQANETAIVFGTMDANGTELLSQVKSMVTELQSLGLPGVQPILDKYGFTTKVDSATLTSGFHILAKNKTKFLG